MDPTVLVAVITSCTTLVAVLSTLTVNLRSARQARRTQVLDLVARYRDPLLWAAFDLRTMLYSWVELNTLHKFHQEPSMRAKAYLDWSVFAVCQYLGWVEIFRRGIQFIDLGHDQRNQELFSHIHAVTRAFSSSGLDGEELSLLRNEQRAIGEAMTLSTGTRDEPADCLAFTTFQLLLAYEPDFARWISPVQDGVDKLAALESARTERVVMVQNRLSELIEFLDPKRVRFPSRLRDRLALPEFSDPRLLTDWEG
jgi:hypothetical protein